MNRAQRRFARNQNQFALLQHHIAARSSTSSLAVRDTAQRAHAVRDDHHHVRRDSSRWRAFMLLRLCVCIASGRRRP